MRYKIYERIIRKEDGTLYDESWWDSGRDEIIAQNTIEARDICMTEGFWGTIVKKNTEHTKAITGPNKFKCKIIDVFEVKVEPIFE